MTDYIKREDGKLEPLKIEPNNDLVVVVRCKDCRYYCKHEFFSRPYFTCDMADRYLTGDTIGVTFEPLPDYYCADGERVSEDD